MHPTSRVCQAIHGEHLATMALTERLAQFIARHGHEPPEIAAGAARLLADIAAGVETEMRRHFDFEEGRLFAYLEGAGEHAIGAHLCEEHEIIRPLGVRLVETARTAAARGFDEAAWSEFRRLGQDFCERVTAHVQKEEVALLPLLEEALDADADARLHAEYVGNE